MKKQVKWLATLVGAITLGGLFHGIRNKSPQKYSREWIEGLSEDMWEKEREIVRQNSINSQLSISEITRWENIRHLFDDVKGDRYGAGKTPQGPAYHREHGYNLYKKE